MPVLRLQETLDSAQERGVAEASRPVGHLDKASVQAELDEMMYVLNQNGTMEPDQAMLMCSGFLARLTELYVQIQRVEHMRRDLKSVRTQEVASILETVRDIYKIHSRLITVRALDQDLTR
jgi:hypothetical protein